MELRSVLFVVHNRDICRCVDTSSEIASDERQDKTREGQIRPHTIFYEILILISLQSTYCLIRPSQFHAKSLTSLKEVTILVR